MSRLTRYGYEWERKKLQEQEKTNLKIQDDMVSKTYLYYLIPD